MARFDVVVHRLADVVPHPNADRLELARVDGYYTVVAKGSFSSGELVAYIPEAAILPAELIADLGLTGKLAGPDFNRVKAVLLRGMLSQGIVVRARPGWELGQSVMDELGVTKFDPGVPPGSEGERYALEQDEYVAFDIENIKSYPYLITEGEEVVMTEKVHGVFMAVGAVLPNDDPARPHYKGRAFVSSKGVLSERNAFVVDGETSSAKNMYVEAAKDHGLFDKACAISDHFQTNVFVLGELFGVGVQDLGYGGIPGARQFRAFAVALLTSTGWRWLDDEDLDETLLRFDIPRVPVVYRGPFSSEALEQATNGRELVSGQAAHIREGVVVVPVVERQSGELPTLRVALKSVSSAYLSRKGGTEYC